MEREKAKRAFEMVDPGKRGLDWRSPINAFVTVAELEAAGLGIEDVKEAVAFFTATEATATRHDLRNVWGPDCWHVTALGYRAGPAGP
jgi:hypothetical protein